MESRSHPVKVWRGSALVDDLARPSESGESVAKLTSSLLDSSLPFILALVGLPGSDTPSLSDMLGLLPF